MKRKLKFGVGRRLALAALTVRRRLPPRTRRPFQRAVASLPAPPLVALRIISSTLYFAAHILSVRHASSVNPDSQPRHFLASRPRALYCASEGRGRPHNAQIVS